MGTSKGLAAALAILGAVFVACGVDAVDLADKTCPCPSDLVCDTAADRCVLPGSIKPVTTTPPCTPRACDTLGVECGETNDGCGALLDCGRCALPNTTCIAETHKCTCQPQNCAAQGAECGEVPSGCGDTFVCGTCPADRPNCGGNGPNKCGTGACVPKSCTELGACGKISDGCGKTLDCGLCKAPAVCGGGGVANKCGCTAKTCAQVGWQCGSGTDNCGGTRTCPPCGGSSTCDTAKHTCSCVPATCASARWQCGTGSDGCGGTLTCPACPSGFRCDGEHKCDD